MAGQDISLFPRYSQQENRTTNYTLLLLRLLYEESPALYEDFLRRLLPDANVATLPRFTQQEKAKGGGVLDGVISQPSYTVFVEAKRTDAFDDDQMKRHLKALIERTGDVRVLLALSSFSNGDQQALATQYQALADSIVRKRGGKAGGRVTVAAKSFADLLAALPRLGLETSFARTLREYEAYLNAEGLLSSWRTLLDVVPVGKWPHQFTGQLVYSCPTKGAAFVHKRSAYLGRYLKGRVTHVAPIQAMVRVPRKGTAKVVWHNDPHGVDEELIVTARERAVAAWGGIDEDLHVFVLGEPQDTDFVKDTPGGPQTRTYIKLDRLSPLPSSAAEVAATLRGRVWSEFV
jgi:hypothetical protein